MRLYWIFLSELDGKICLKVSESEKAKLNLKHTNGRYWLVFFFNFISPLSLLKSAEFTEMCPRGKGFVPTGESSYDVDGENYKGQNQAETNLQWVCIFDIQVNAWLGLEEEFFSAMGTNYKALNPTIGRRLQWTLGRTVPWVLEHLRLYDSGTSLKILSFHFWDRNNVSKVVMSIKWDNICKST